MVKAMGMLGNSTRGLFSLQKYFLYHSCVIPIATYSFRLWLFAGAPTKAQVLLLTAIQHKAAFQILGVFCTSPTGGIEALASFIPIYLYLKKLVKEFCLKTATFPLQYILISLLSAKYSKGVSSHPQSLVLLNNIQCVCLKGSVLYIKASLLNPLDTEATLGYRLLDNFPDHISFHSCNHSSLRDCKTYLQSLDYLCLEVFFSSSTFVVVTNSSIILSRHMQAASTVYIWSWGQQILSSKALAITALDAELFAIRLGIAKTTSMTIEYIILITDSLESAK